MFCLNCGEKIGEYDTFCSYCGAKQIFNVEKSDDYNGWFYIAGNYKHGPFSLDEMAAAIDDEIVKRDTFVWHGGMSQWVLAEQTALKAYLKHVVPPLPDEIIDNKFVWMLATIPILVSWALLFVVSDFKWITIAMVVLNVVFLSLDISNLRKYGKEPAKWLWLGFVLVPIYLFFRAARTDRNYAYGITWCVLFVFDIILF